MSMASDLAALIDSFGDGTLKMGDLARYDGPAGVFLADVVGPTMTSENIYYSTIVRVDGPPQYTEEEIAFRDAYYLSQGVSSEDIPRDLEAGMQAYLVTGEYDGVTCVTKVRDRGEWGPSNLPEPVVSSFVPGSITKPEED